MKFFEVNNPYYALLKADNKEEAMKKYVQNVGEDDGILSEEMKEVDREYALVKFSQAYTEDKILLPIGEVLYDFNCQKTEVIVIDGGLV